MPEVATAAPNTSANLPDTLTELLRDSRFKYRRRKEGEESRLPHWTNDNAIFLSKLVRDRADEMDQKINTVAQVIPILADAMMDTMTLALRPERYWDGTQPHENVLMYNPDTLSWQSMEYFSLLALSAVIPSATLSQGWALGNYLFTHIHLQHLDWKVPEPYSGSRYVLFDNGIFDAKNKQLIPIHEDYIDYYPGGNSPVMTAVLGQVQTLDVDGKKKTLAQMGFTDKHVHHFSLDLNAPNPEYASNVPDVKWTPKDWTLKTSNNRSDEANYLLRCLGTMLVPNHSFNAFLEINGLSGGGKTKLVEIVKSIYGRESTAVKTGFTLDDVSDNFPFRGTVTQDTALAHITETNGAGLKNSTIPLINSFANSEMQIKQLGGVSVELTPPPFLVMEGKGWVLFDNTKTGVARRLLPLDISKAQTKHYLCRRYGKDVFMQPKVLAWFAKEAMLAYADMTKGNDHFKFSIDNIKTLPKFAQKWHLDAINAGDDVMNQFVERMKHILKPGYISTELLFKLYQQSALLDDPDAFQRKLRSFKEAILVYLRQSFNLEKIKQPAKFSEEQLAFSFDELQKMLPLPPEISNYATTKFAKYTTTNWYKLTYKKDDED